jgi:hypothetical protein
VATEPPRVGSSEQLSFELGPLGRQADFLKLVGVMVIFELLG